MSLIQETFNLRTPFSDLFPKEWNDTISGYDNVVFNNLDHFVYTVSKLTQKSDDYCGMSYKKALDMLVKRQSDFPESEQTTIRNLVRKNLLKRGLITEEIYEAFKYDTGGTQVGVDVGKYAAGEADCVITPARQYIDFFYEMYVSISYEWGVSNTTIRENVAKLLATVEELERQHIYIKINAVLPIIGCSNGKYANFFSSIPIFSHKDFKSVSTMSAVINDRLLRKFYFAILEDTYGSDLRGGYGTPVSLPKTLNIGKPLNEIELFEEISTLARQ